MSKYDVGYKKPPKHSQFKPGQSGNPKGRKKDQKNLKTELLEEMHTTVTIQEHGKRQTLTKQRVMLKQLLNQAMQGNTQSIKLILGWVNTFFNEQEGLKAETSQPLDDADEAILNHYLRNMKKDEN